MKDRPIKRGSNKNNNRYKVDYQRLVTVEWLREITEQYRGLPAWTDFVMYMDELIEKRIQREQRSEESLA